MLIISDLCTFFVQRYLLLSIRRHIFYFDRTFFLRLQKKFPQGGNTSCQPVISAQSGHFNEICFSRRPGMIITKVYFQNFQS